MITYADPTAAQPILDKLARMTKILDECPTSALVAAAADVAWSYISGEGPQASARYYASIDKADARAEATEALAWFMCFGANGSDEQHAASHATRWADTYGV